MKSRLQSAELRRPWVQRAAAAVPAAVGIAGLWGWWSGGIGLLSIHEIPIAANSALALLLVSVVCSGLIARWPRVERLFGAGVLGLAVLALVRINFGWGVTWDPPSWPGRAALSAGQSGAMSWMAAVNFAMLGAMLVFQGGPRLKMLWRLFTGFMMATSIFSIGAIAQAARLGTDSARLGPMSAWAALGLLGASLALELRARRGLSARERPLAAVQSMMAIALALIGSVALAGWRSNQLQSLANRRIVASYEVIESVNYVELCLTRMESAARAYALGHEPRFIAVYDDMAWRLVTEEKILARRIADDPAQTARVRALVKTNNAKRAFMGRVIADVRDGRMELRPENFRAPEGANLMAEVRRLVNTIDRAERLRLAERSSAYDTEASATGEVIVSGALLAVGLFLAASFTLLRADRRRAQAELALERTNSLQRAVLDGTVFAVVSTRVDGTIATFNAGAEKMLGYRRTEMVGRATPAIFHLEEELAARAAELSASAGQSDARGFDVFSALARRGEVDEREWTFVRKDGSRLRVWLSVTALRSESGAINGFLGIAHDLTERKKAEALVQESRERLATIFAATDEGLVLQGPQGQVIECNDAACRILGLTREQLTGRDSLDPRWTTIYEDGTPFPGDAHPAPMAFRTREAQRDIVQGIRRADGVLAWIRISSVPVVEADGTVHVVVTSFTDISEQKRLIENLAQARDQALEGSRLKSEFLANMSHEIRTPMNGVIGMADLLLGTELDANQREMAQVVQKSAESLLTIVNDILDFSKIEAGKMQIEVGDFDLPQLVEETATLLTPPAALKQVRVTWRIAPEVPRVAHGDNVRVRQVLTNLIGNAVKFTDAGAVDIEVRAAAGGVGRVRFEVRDTGPGISAEQQTRLFGAFVQGDGSTTRRHGGTGLGLAISRQLVELMGGSIGFVSQPGQGSVFWFELNLSAPRDTTPPIPRSATPTSAAGATPARHFLVAEDNEANQLVVRSLLAQLGHTCEIVEDGETALQALAAVRFDGVLMDCQMPRMDGYTAARKIRSGAVPGCERVPIIALTAYAMPEDRAKCLAAGMNQYVSKPLRTGALRAALAACGFGTVDIIATLPSSDSEAAVLDEKQIAQLREIPGRKHPQLLFELLALFRETTPDVLAKLAAALTAQDRENVELLAHRLAGSCAHIGAFAMRASALALERAAREQDSTLAAVEFEHLQAEWKRVERAVADLAP